MNTIERVLRFLKNMLSSSDDSVSSRRVTAFISLLVICFCTVMDVLFKKTVSMFIFDGLVMILLVCFGLTTITNFKSIKPDATSKDSKDVE